MAQVGPVASVTLGWVPVGGTVLAYITDRAGALKVSTLSRHLAAIRAAHSHARAPLDLHAHLDSVQEVRSGDWLLGARVRTA